MSQHHSQLTATTTTKGNVCCIKLSFKVSSREKGGWRDVHQTGKHISVWTFVAVNLYDTCDHREIRELRRLQPTTIIIIDINDKQQQQHLQACYNTKSSINRQSLREAFNQDLLHAGNEFRSFRNLTLYHRQQEDEELRTQQGRARF